MTENNSISVFEYFSILGYISSNLRLIINNVFIKENNSYKRYLCYNTCQLFWKIDEQELEQGILPCNQH